MTIAPPTPLLVIEASTAFGSVALVGVDAGQLMRVLRRDVPMGVSRDDGLLPAIVDLLREAQMTSAQLSAIACGSGPGSFTSLRIAAALAKGFAMAHDVALYAVPSLLLAGGSLPPGKFSLHADALRSERFVLDVDVHADASVHEAGPLVRLSATELRDHATTRERTLVPIVTRVNDVDLMEPLVPDAGSVTRLATQWSNFGPVSLASWEPSYGRLAEAQVKWETVHGRPLPAL